MKLYESVYIVRQDIPLEELKKTEEKYESLLKLKKAIIEYKENWGLRGLAYKIKNNKKGYYFMLVYNAENDAVEEFERKLKIDEDIIRFLTTRIDKIPEEPSPIMKAKIEKENTENMVKETNMNKPAENINEK
tara:strand:- start:435 stop:833 length:399 start_codon:yes stop_codon:yes gene_type:complete